MSLPVGGVSLLGFLGGPLYHAFYMTRQVCIICLCIYVLQLQKGKEREEQLEDVIQAYEKIHMEKTSLQRDLDKMVRALLLKHSCYASHPPLTSTQAKFGCWADGQLW